ncbi:MAG: ABC transporter permease [Candidatus Acidiferrales bacterium]
MPQGLQGSMTGLLRIRKKLRLSWTTVLTLLLGFACHSTAVRQVGALLFNPAAGGSDIVDRYLQTQLRNSEIDTGSSPSHLVLVAGPHHTDPLLTARETPFTLTGHGDTDIVVGASVSTNTFARLTTRPMLGRSLQPGDEFVRHPVVVMSERLWRRRFGAERGLIGKTITLNRQHYKVIGVMPASFWFPYRSDPVELWVPERAMPDTNSLNT